MTSNFYCLPNLFRALGTTGDQKEMEGNNLFLLLVVYDHANIVHPCGSGDKGEQELDKTLVQIVQRMQWHVWNQDGVATRRMEMVMLSDF